MKILYQDPALVVLIKDPGLESESIDSRTVFPEDPEGVLFCVHRLDREAGGVMVFARTGAAAAALSAAFAEGRVKKTYLALAEGSFPEKEGTLEDLLFHDRASNKTYVVKRERKGVRKASLSYRVLGEISSTENPSAPETSSAGNPSAMNSPSAMNNLSDAGTSSPQNPSAAPVPLTLLEVRLHTGRTHQIRIQFASRKHPLAGDRRYGSRSAFAGFGLWCHQLSFPHPLTGETLSFSSDPDFFPELQRKSSLPPCAEPSF